MGCNFGASSSFTAIGFFPSGCCLFEQQQQQQQQQQEEIVAKITCFYCTPFEQKEQQEQKQQQQKEEKVAQINMKEPAVHEVFHRMSQEIQTN